MNTIKAVILAGGKGTRLRPLTYSIPKPMLPVGGKPFIEYLIILLKKFGISEIILCTGYLSNTIEEYFKDGSEFGVNIKYSIEKEELGTGGAIKNAEKYLDNKFIVLNGDSYLEIDYKDFIEYSKKKNSKYTIALTKVENPERYGLVEIDNEGRITNFFEKEQSKKQSKEKLINSGVYLFEPEIFDYMPKGKSSLEKEIFPKIINSMYGYICNGYFIDMGVPESYEKIKKGFL